MDKVDWYILNSFSDDHETIETMRYGLFDENVSIKELSDRIFLLSNLGLLNAFDEKGRLIEDFKYTDIHCDTWFGLTELGGKTMEETALELVGEEISWENAYSQYLSYKDCEGHIYARTHQRCIELLNEVRTEDKVIVLDESIDILPVESYTYKYYITLIGGYKLTFKFRKKDCSSVFMAIPGSVGQETSPNNIFTLRACSRVVSATPSHRATSAAKEKGSAGPVRRRRKTETLVEIERGEMRIRAHDLEKIIKSKY